MLTSCSEIEVVTYPLLTSCSEIEVELPIPYNISVDTGFFQNELAGTMILSFHFNPNLVNM